MTRIVRDPAICSGRPRIGGTRLRTDYVYGVYEGCADRSVATVLNLFPWLTPEQVRAAIAYERRPHRRLIRWVRGWAPEIDGTVRWRGREWDWG